MCVENIFKMRIKNKFIIFCFCVIILQKIRGDK